MRSMATRFSCLIDENNRNHFENIFDNFLLTFLFTKINLRVKKWITDPLLTLINRLQGLEIGMRICF